MKKIIIGVVMIMTSLICSSGSAYALIENDIFVYCVQKYVPISENTQEVYTTVVSRNKTTNEEITLFIMNGVVEQLFTIGDYIFIHSTNGIYKYSMNGEGIKQLVDGNKRRINSFTVYENNIYYCIYNPELEHFQIMKCDLDGNNKTVLLQKVIVDKFTPINDGLIYSDMCGVGEISGTNQVAYVTNFEVPMPGGEGGRHFVIDDKIIISGYAEPEEYKEYGSYPTIILDFNGNVVDIWKNCFIHNIEKSNGKIYAQIDNMRGDGGNTTISRGLYCIANDFKEKHLALSGTDSYYFRSMYIKDNNIYFVSKFGDWFKGHILQDGTIENVVAEPKEKYTDQIVVFILRKNLSGSATEYNSELVTLDVPPTIENDRVVVPMRAIFEALGATVDWDNDTQTVTAKKNDTEISLQIGNDILYKNHEEISLDVPAKIVNDRTLVPIRAVSEGLGARVEWDGTAQAVLIWTN